MFALNLVIGLGLGLAIDYTLFLLTRFREELARGATTREAIRVTLSQAGRTVLFSAVTVACALATLTVFPLGFAWSMGIAGRHRISAQGCRAGGSDHRCARGRRRRRLGSPPA